MAYSIPYAAPGSMDFRGLKHGAMASYTVVQGFYFTDSAYRTAKDGLTFIQKA